MSFSSKSKNIIDIFKKNGLDCSWATIQVGWELGLLSLDEIHRFALDFSENDPDLINKHISEIIFSTDKHEVKNILANIFSSLELHFPTPHSFLWNKERQKWRYCILKDVTQEIQGTEELLVKVESVYADFGYPEDMKPFIYYMGADEEVANLKPDDARDILVKRLKNFLMKERLKLDE